MSKEDAASINQILKKALEGENDTVVQAAIDASVALL